MKSLICVEPGRLEYAEKPAPVITPGNAIIKIKRIGICGTDLHAFEGTQPYFQYPRVLGHELSAEIADISPNNGFKPGDIVTIMPYFYCGKCYACRNGKTNCCANLRVAGVHTDGGFADYFSVPEYSLIHGNGLSHDQLALVEPLAIGAHGIRRAAVKHGEIVLIIGAGPIGMALIAFAKMTGARVMVMDVNKFRLDFCREQLNVEAINAADKTASQQFEDLTNGELAHVVIDATGNIRAINNAFGYMSHGGRYILVGLQKENIVFSHPDFHKKEGTLMSSRNATVDDFNYVIESIASGKIDPLKFITHRAAFGRVKEQFANWLNPANNVIKAVVEI
ncbi:MAG: zinc-binding alcohol dehydrogenase family protein [Chitinophagaceae bacterium]|nr:zinc-binding alcohol dehydrogenase family protein [Chitinophagaceae bacterium]